MARNQWSRRIGVTLVEDAFGAYPPPPLPAVLSDLLFAGPEARCVALLDAARIDNLPQMLAGGDLAHLCLFQGDAAEELAEVAPWLVELTPESRLARRLLSGDAAQWGLWGRDGAVFLRSKDDLATLRRHFRRMTRLYDRDSDAWLYFRFYAASTMRDLVSGMGAARLARFCGPVERFVIPVPAMREAAVLTIDRPEPARSATDRAEQGGHADAAF